MHSNAIASAIGNVFIVAWLLLLLLSVILVFRKRRAAIIALCLSVTSCVVGVNILPKETGSSSNPPRQATQVTLAAPLAPSGSALTPEALTEIHNLQAAMNNDIDHCNDANRLTAATYLHFKHGRTTLQSAYDRATWASDTCQLAREGLLDLQAPDSGGPAIRDAYRRGLDSCRLAMGAKKDTLAKLQSLLNDGEQPSAIHDFEEDADFDQSESLLCLTDLAVAKAIVGGKHFR